MKTATGIIFAAGFLAAAVAVSVATIPMSLPTEAPEISVHTIPPTENAGENTTKHSASENSVVADLPINLNTATKEELMTLDGIGEKLAERIIAYRLEGNCFYSVDEITLVDGIGDSFLEKNADRIFVDTESIPVVATVTTPPETETETTRSETTTTAEETTVTTTEETTVTTTEETTTVTEDEWIEPVNLNTCDFDDLMTLPITEEQALAILELREKIDYFTGPRELILADGIDYATYNRIEPYVYV